MSVDDGIREFWTWWQTARDRVLSAIEVERNFSEELVTDISRHVDAIGELDWELCPGRTSKHAFCLSPKGDPEARLVTELWRSRGPAPDETWEYFAARQGTQGLRLEIEGFEVDRTDVQVAFEVDGDRERIDATYFHPAFAEMPEDLRGTALFLLLDGALGEDGVERWLGSIEPVTEAPEGAVPFADFQEALLKLEADATGEQFVVLQGQTESGEPLFVTCNQALKRIDYLLHTQHVSIELAILEQNPHGLTTSADAEKLNAIEDELTAELGEHAVYFGRETRPGKRILHWYAPEDGAAQGVIERWAARHSERTPNVLWNRDATWEVVKQYA